MQPDGTFGAATAVAEVNTNANEDDPHVSRNGHELYFSRHRRIIDPNDTIRGQVMVSERNSSVEPWSEPASVGPTTNTLSNEVGPSLSWDGTELYFGRAFWNGTALEVYDIWKSTRTKIKGPKP